MMKKEYFAPEMEIIDIKTDQYLLAGSLQTSGLDAVILLDGVSDTDDEAD